jgi:pSer/pThr/pTyr-binding forkhead associated (FHA) protein
MTQPIVHTQGEHYLIIKDDRGRKEVLLTEKIYTLGRSPNCDIPLKSQFVSRHHATLIRQTKEDNSVYYQIIDGDGKEKSSANGLLLNHKKLAVHNLRSGDEVIFAPQVSILYQYRRRDEFLTAPGNDPFDITLIDPSMMEDDDDSPTLMPTTQT